MGAGAVELPPHYGHQLARGRAVARRLTSGDERAELREIRPPDVWQLHASALAIPHSRAAAAAMSVCKLRRTCFESQSDPPVREGLAAGREPAGVSPIPS
jgi:hypothetical protein